MTLLQVLLMFPYLKYAIKLKQEKLVAFMHLWLWWSTCFHVKANNSLRPGDTLNYTETGKVITKNGKYFLAFYTIVDDTYLAVWKTNWDTYWVWLSDRNQPVDPDSAVLSLNHSGVLKIESQRGKPIILYSPPQPINNTVATLLDTGNFVLQQLHPNGSTMSVLWQSFDYPIDTMIPTMKLGVNHKTGHNWSLVSYFANDDINIVTPGAFSLEWEPVGEELVIRRRGKVSWRSGKLRNNRFEHISEDAQRTLNYTVVSNADESSFSFTTTNDDVDVLWWIASDGQLNNYSETVVWADMCYGYNTDEGCQRWEDIPECRSRGDVYQRKTGHLNFEYAISEPNMSYGLSDCQAMCWSNCSCTGYKEHNHNGTGCTFFSSGPYYTLSDVGERFYMLGNVTQQIDKSTAKSEPPGTKKFIWISALIATILLIICLFSVCLILKKRKYMFQDKKKKGMVTKMLHLATCKGTSSRKEFEDDLKHGLELKAFTYISIMEATDGFSSENKLGQGGFGPVYKGIFSTGQEVAIKRLSKSSTQGIVEFKNELKLICELQHMNLVQLLGYCIHEEERILLYEYMPNKSLDFFIFDCTRRKLLDWKKRFNIIEGIAQGLLYLHKYSRLKVIHRDLKASNILLDENWNPKISDFGMARIFTQQEPVENTNRVVGTYGYMSPEYAMEGIFSTKSDVYSFGVLLLEIISGRRNTSFYDDDHPLNLIGHAWELWNVGEPLQLVDQSLNESFEPDEVQRCIHVGLLCVEQYTNDRPTMFDILSMLTNKSAIVSLPQRPAFYVKREISNRSLSSKELLTDSTFEITTSGKMESR